MGLFSNIFGKKASGANEPKPTNTSLQPGEEFFSVGNDIAFKTIRELTAEQEERIERSTIQLMATQLYMHYWTDELVPKSPNDQEWQNKVVFFWKAEERFPQKSLPPTFETCKARNFVFVGNIPNLSLGSGKTIPWFGMPGGGEKFFCAINGQNTPIPELTKLGVVQYVEPVELSNNNPDILTDQKGHFFLIDQRITQFKNNSFYLRDTPVSIAVAYKVGGIHIVKKVIL